MVERITFLLILLSCFGQVRAQSNLQPGYIIQLSGDTVHGEVDVLGTQRSIRRCVFRTSPSTAFVTYLPEEIRGYGISKVKSYRSGLVPVVDTMRQMRFMEILVRGKATLLLSSDDNHDPHFFMQRREGSAPEELRLITRTQVNEGRLYKLQIKQYQQTLLAAFSEYPELVSEIRKARFVIQDLVAVFEHYNAKAGGTIQINAMALERTKFRLGIVGGVPLSSKMEIRSTKSGLGYYNAKLSGANSPIYGLQMAMNSPRLSRSLWLQLGALYQHRNYTGRSNRGSAQTSILDDYYSIAFEADFLRLPVVLRFEPINGRVRPLIEVGITSNLRLNESHNEYTINYTNNQTPTQRKLFENARVYEQGLLTGLGLTTALSNGHHASMMLRYELTNGVTAATAISSTCHTFFALLSYDLVGK